MICAYDLDLYAESKSDCINRTYSTDCIYLYVYSICPICQNAAYILSKCEDTVEDEV